MLKALGFMRGFEALGISMWASQTWPWADHDLERAILDSQSPKQPALVVTEKGSKNVGAHLGTGT